MYFFSDRAITVPSIHVPFSAYGFLRHCSYLVWSYSQYGAAVRSLAPTAISPPPAYSCALPAENVRGHNFIDLKMKGREAGAQRFGIVEQRGHVAASLFPWPKKR